MGEKRIQEMENEKGGSEEPMEVGQTLAETRKTILELKKSIEKAELGRRQNIKEIVLIREEVSKTTEITKRMMVSIMENKKSSETADKVLHEKLMQIKKAIVVVHKQIETQISQLQKEMVMVQDRLEVCEAKIVEVSRDVQSVKVEMQKMQEILMKIKAQGTSSVTNINVNNINSKTEVTKEIETKVKVMIEKW